MFKYVCKLSLVTAKLLKLVCFYFGFTGYNMPVAKVLVVQIQSDTIISYSEQVRHKECQHFSLLSGTHFNLGLNENLCLFIKFILSVSKFCKK